MTQVIKMLGLDATSLDQLAGELAQENGSTLEEATVLILREIKRGVIDIGLGVSTDRDDLLETYVTLELSQKGIQEYSQERIRQETIIAAANDIIGAA